MKLILIFLLLSGNLFSQSWDDSFTIENLSKSFIDNNLKLVVVYSGENQEELKLVYNSLTSRLKEMKNISKVLHNKVIGDVITLDNKSIVKRASFLDVNNIVIIRVFLDNKKYSSVISIYNKDGNLLGNIFAERNSDSLKDTLKSNLKKDEQIKITITDTKKEIKNIKENKFKKVERKIVKRESNLEDSEEYQKKLDEFDENYITFEKITLFTLSDYGNYLSLSTSTWHEPIIGKYERKITWPEFYTMVGREDLTDKYNSNVSTSYLVIGIGGSIVIGSLVYPFFRTKPYSDSEIDNAGAFSNREQTMRDANEKHLMHSLLIGFGGTIIGISTIGLGMYLYSKRQPVKQYQAMKLADQYNKKLKNKLGLVKKKKHISYKLNYTIIPYLGKQSGFLLNIKF